MPSRRMFVGALSAIVVLLGVNGYVSLSSLLSVHDSTRHVAHSQQVKVQLTKVLSTLKDAETGQRGFLLSESEAFLEPYYQGIDSARTDLSELQELTSDNPAHQRRIAAISLLVEQRLAILEQTVRLARQRKLAQAVQVVKSGVGKQHMDAIRRLVAEMESEENQLLQQRDSLARANYLRGAVSLFFATALSTVLVGLLFFLGWRSTQQVHLAARAAMEQRERFRVTLESIGDAVLVTDEQGKITFANPHAEQLTGWPQEQALGQALDTVFVIQDETTGEPVENPVARVLRDGMVVGLANHTVLISRDHQQHAIADSAAPIRGPNGALHGVVLVFHDVTSRRQAELALQASESRYRLLAEKLERLVSERTRELETRAAELAQTATALRNSEQSLRSIYDSSPDCILVLDLAGHVEEMNEPGRCLMEITNFSLLHGCDWAQLWPEATRPAVRTAITTALQGKVGRFQGWCPTALGKLNYWDVLVAPIQGDSGLSVRLVSVSRDSTENKRAEQRLEVQHAITRLLAESEINTDVPARLIEVLGGALDWDIAELWDLDTCHILDARGIPQTLQRRHFWQIPSADFPRFHEVTATMNCPAGLGLPGQAWSQGKPVWMEDVARETTFLRGETAAAEGIHGAVAFPIQGPLGPSIVALYSRHVQPLDPDMVRVFGIISGQIGQYLHRKFAEEESRRTATELQGIIRAFPDLFFRLGPDGIIRDYQAGRESNLHVLPGEFLGRRMQDVLPGEIGAKFEKALLEARLRKTVVPLEYEMQ